MRVTGFLAIGFAAVLAAGCAGGKTEDTADNRTDPIGPNMTAELTLGHSSDSIVSKYGKPLYKKARMDNDGKKLEDWFYPNAMLSFKEGNLIAFKPK